MHMQQYQVGALNPNRGDTGLLLQDMFLGDHIPYKVEDCRLVTLLSEVYDSIDYELGNKINKNKGLSNQELNIKYETQIFRLKNAALTN